MRADDRTIPYLTLGFFACAGCVGSHHRVGLREPTAEELALLAKIAKAHGAELDWLLGDLIDFGRARDRAEQVAPR